MTKRMFIVLAVISTLILGSTTAVARPGDPDTGFGGEGVIRDGSSSSMSGGTDLVVQPDGKIIAAGWRSPAQSPGKDASVYRFRSDGQLDASFGSAGIAAIPIPDVRDTVALARRDDGKLVVAAITGYDPTTIALARLDRQGRLDPTFGGGGVILTGVEVADFPYAIDVGLAPGDRIVVAGAANSDQSFPGEGGGMLVARFLANGTLDPSLTGTGLSTVAPGPSTWANTVAVLGGGKIALGGSSNHDSAVALIRPSGAPVRRFSGDGIATYKLEAEGQINDLAAGSKGSLVAAGSISGSGFVTRFKRGGQLDRGFGDGRPVYVPDDEEIEFSELTAVGIDAAGRVVAAGAAQFLGTASWGGDGVVLRFRGDGSVSKRFGDGGVARIDLGGMYDELRSLEIAPDGGLVAVGAAIDGLRSLDSFQLAVTKLTNR